MQTIFGALKEFNDDAMLMAKQLGTNSIHFNTPPIAGEKTWEADALQWLVDYSARFGLKVGMIENVPIRFYDKVLLGTEGRDEQGEKEVQLPPIHVGDSFEAKSILPEQKFTQPPARYTEATLVKTLEEKGIGRPSTYAPTITTIVDRGYVLREKKVLMPTELGFVVTRLMKENFKGIVDVAFTAGMEEKLDEVEEGTVPWQQVVADFYGPFEKELEAAGANIDKVKLPDPVSDVPCDKCGAMMVIKTGRFGKFLACPNFPACRNTKPLVEKLDVQCPKCGGDIIKRRTKKGKTFFGCANYPACDFVSWDKPVPGKCPQCGGILVQRMGQNGPFIACGDRACGYIQRGKKEKE
ncbi:MAG: topoisomerase DNA-binding C4 zinc finger domain-containing protein [Clostridia bacterium]|nr:topoisomerase DNA-binding C4 zinc finger domain-containing protein [Clostridia bacterium]